MELRCVLVRNACGKKTMHYILARHAQEQVEMSGVWPAGQVPSSPNATTGVLGPPKRPGLTPGSCALTMPTSSWLRGGWVQYGVDGMMPPPISSALRACWRYAIAAAMRSAWFVTPGDLAKSIILSAFSCWSQTPPVERSALMPSIPARLTHG